MSGGGGGNGKRPPPADSPARTGVGVVLRRNDALAIELKVGVQHVHAWRAVWEGCEVGGGCLWRAGGRGSETASRMGERDMQLNCAHQCP